VYRNTPHSAKALRNEITNLVALILADKLKRVLQGFLQRCMAFLRVVDKHFEHFCNIW
jgi:hypothetical protein